MKRIIFLVLTLSLAMTLALAACGKGECDMCGQSEKLNTYSSSGGSTMKLCDDCYQLAKFLGS